MLIESLSAVDPAATRGVAGPAPGAAAAAAGPSFSDALGQVVGQTVGSLQAGEAAAIQGVVGATPPFKVVEAVMGAQRSLQAALAIRDKAVGAYQEIARMAI
jgi:flagellar hook-basal body complex protein FliE